MQDHKTALMLACLEKSYDFVCILLENGADADAKDCVSGTFPSQNVRRLYAIIDTIPYRKD